MSHTQKKLTATMRHLLITCSFILFSAVSILLLSSWQKPSNFKRVNDQAKSFTHSSPFKGTLRLNLDGNGQISGTGVGTHLGRFDFLAQDDESNFPVLNGTVILTAANGDQVFASHTGNVQELGGGYLRITLQHTITGGTGRFLGATGDFVIISIANTNNGTATANLEGSISY